MSASQIRRCWRFVAPSCLADVEVGSTSALLLPRHVRATLNSAVLVADWLSPTLAAGR